MGKRFNSINDTEKPEIPGSRQIIEMHVDLVQKSCRMAVPLMDYVADREELNKWAEKKEPEKLRQYQQEKYTFSLDGRPIDIR